jgi:hypothetical protein
MRKHFTLEKLCSEKIPSNSLYWPFVTIPALSNERRQTMNNTPTTRAQKLLLAIDAFPLDALWRIAAGFAVFPLADLFFGKKDSVGSSLGGLLGVLLLIRLLPLVIRKSIPFSMAVAQTWRERRGTAKNYDSYQWKKMLWVGIGMLSYIAVSDLFWVGRISIASACVLLGGIGMLRWRLIAPKVSPQYKQS